MQINKEAESEVVKRKLKKTQKDWEQYFNGNGMKMISAPDFYEVAKKERKELIESLQQDFKESWVVTSTRIVYNKDDLDAEIIHDAGSNIVKPKSIKVKIPYIWGEAKDDTETEAYLQALFDTKNKLSEIKRDLNRFNEKGKDRKLHLWTPNQSSRSKKQVRSVRLGFVGFGRFNVDGNNWFDDDFGFSRGVIVQSAKQTPKSGGIK